MTNFNVFDFMNDARHDLERDEVLLVPLNHPVLMGWDVRDANVVFKRIADNCIGPIRPRLSQQVINGSRHYVWTATHLTHEPDGDYIGYIVESAAIEVFDDRRGTRYEFHSLKAIQVVLDEMNIHADPDPA